MTTIRTSWNQSVHALGRPHWFEPGMNECIKQMKEAAHKGTRAMFEVRDARIPCLSHPSIEALTCPPYSYRRMICYTHCDLLHDRDLPRITDYAKSISSGVSPLLLKLADHKHGPEPRTSVIRSSMISFLFHAYDGKYDPLYPLRSFAVGFPNVGKSTFLYVSTQAQTRIMRKKQDYHLPKVANIPGYTTVLKPHWLSIKDPPARIMDTPGINLPRGSFVKDRESFYKLSLIGCLQEKFYIQEVEDVLDYLLFKLNRSGHLDYVQYLNISDATDDVEQLIQTLLDDGATQTDRTTLALRIINQWRRGEFGRMCLDQIPNSQSSQL
uniref:G domain-containing protein n=1 Tax=Spongospora subterranea TaxID=70186 RepID=A0A0H5RB24_9EUKA|eukprot:CRZ10812.1 hypothetical protein [Spongospora subterranea]